MTNIQRMMMAAAGVGGDTIESLAPLVWFKASGIVGATPVTAWTNSGSGGSGYDLDTVTGTAANLTKTTINSVDVVDSSGSVRIETTAAQNISGAYTAYLVAILDTTNAQRLTDDTVAAGSNRHAMFVLSGGPDWAFSGGSNISTVTADTALHIWTVQFNGDATTKLTVGTDTVTGDAGSNSWDFATFFGRRDGGLLVNGRFAEFALFNSAQSDGDIATVQAELSARFGL